MEARAACSETSCDKNPGVTDKFAHFIFASRLSRRGAEQKRMPRPPPRQTTRRNNVGYRLGFTTPTESELIRLVQNKI